MRALPLTLLSLGLLATPLAFGDHFQRKAMRAEVAHLHGTWKVASVEGFDQHAADDMKSVELKIHGKTLDARWGENKSAVAEFRVDPTATPPTIDIMVTKGPEDAQGKMFHGIYSLDGNTLKIAYRKPGEAAPKTVTAAEQGVHVVTLKKEIGK